MPEDNVGTALPKKGSICQSWSATVEYNWKGTDWYKRNCTLNSFGVGFYGCNFDTPFSDENSNNNDFLYVFKMFECNHSARESNILENIRTLLWKALLLLDKQ